MAKKGQNKPLFFDHLFNIHDKIKEKEKTGTTTRFLTIEKIFKKTRGCLY